MNSKRPNDLAVGVIGLGHIGLPLASLLANGGITVVAYDVDSNRVKQVKAGSPGFHEPGLEQLLRDALQTGCMLVTDEEASLAAVEVPMITIGTPWNEREGIIDLSQLDFAVKTLGRNLRKGAVVVLKSTVPPLTTEGRVAPQLQSISGMTVGRDFGIAYSPERMIEGQAIQDYKTLPKIIGATDDRTYEKASAVLSALGGKILRVSSPRAAEMVKMLDNYNRDSSLALINQFAVLCMAAGVDVLEIIRAAKLDYPRNAGLLIPGGGVGGSCLNKDPWILSYFGQQHDVDVQFIHTVRAINSNMPMQVVRLAQRMIARLGLTTARLVVAGLAFKSGTDDTRHSPGVVVCKELSKLGHEIVASDPYVKSVEGLDLSIDQNLIEAATGANIIIFMTDWNEYRGLDLRLLRQRMLSSAGFIDARHVLDPTRVLSLGFDFEGIGRPKEAFI